MGIAWTSGVVISLISPFHCRTDHYVRVIGSVKNFNGRRTVNSGHIRLVSDFNEIFYHKLEAMHTHCLITRGANGGVVSLLPIHDGTNCSMLIGTLFGYRSLKVKTI